MVRVGFALLGVLLGGVLFAAMVWAGPEKEGGVAMRDTETPVYSRAGFDVTRLTRGEVDALAEDLTEEEAEIILAKGTEPAFCGTLQDNKRDGVYVCRLCGLPLFSSGAKFDSGTGWPSFFQPVDAAHIDVLADRSMGKVRIESLCARCGGHLGHVFDDGPRPTGLRFCMNSVALDFVGAEEETPARSRAIVTETAYFAGGCFWKIEDRFQNSDGVLDAVSGYQGGETDDPTYFDVCRKGTGHAESVRVVFDPARVTYRELLERFFGMHDPTQMNRQGPDVGEQYRSAIFAADEEQQREATEYIEELARTGKFKRPIVTEVGMAAMFYEAEEKHQDYHEKHGTSCGL